MMNRSIKKNAILNAIKTLCSIAFPLLTFPYASRVLHVENLGKYNYALSIVNYFSLLAGLGISTYAIREGARYRNDPAKITSFSSEIYTINIFSTLFSYVLLFAFILLIKDLKSIRVLLIILSVSNAFTTIGCQWIFSIYEEFEYITIRTICFQIISLILLYVFVKTEADLIKYAIIHVISASGANLINMFYRRRYCKISICLNKSLLTHIKPILVLFAGAIATRIYVNSDMTMLGAIVGEYHVGLYSVSTKVYSIIKELIAALIIVSIPRFSSYIGNNDQENVNRTASKVLSTLFSILLPCVIGIFSLSEKIIETIAGVEYLPATISLKTLCFALIFSIFNWFYSSCILVPYRKEREVLIGTCAAAIFNVLLNIWLIPRMNQDGAAMTTVIAELVYTTLCVVYSKRLVHVSIIKRDVISTIIGCVLIYFICKASTFLVNKGLLSLIIPVIVSSIVYFSIIALFHNSSVESIKDIAKSKRARNGK